MNAPATPAAPADRPGLWLAGLALAYAAAMQAGIHLRYASGSIAMFWPAVGLVVAALLLGGRKMWPAILVTTAAVNLVTNLVAGRSAAEMLVYAATNTGEAWLIAALLQVRSPAPVTFERLCEVLLLALFATVVPAVSGGTGSLLLRPGVEVTLSTLFGTWWITNLVGILLVAPLLVAWIPVIRRIRTWRRAVVLEAAVILLILGAVAWGAFRPGRLQLMNFPSPYMAFLPMAWSAIRYRLPGATGAALGLVAAVLLVIRWTGSQATEFDTVTRMMMVQLYFGTVTLTGLLLAAAMAERDAAVRVSRENESQFRSLFEGSMSALALFREGRLLECNAAFVRLFGYTAVADCLGRPVTDFRCLDPRSGIDAPFRGKRRDGDTFPLQISHTEIDLPVGRVQLTSHQDLTHLARTQRELHRINRSLRAISGCNQALLRASSETELLEGICQVIARSEGFMMAWVGMVEHDARKTVRPVASAGFESGYLEQAEVTWDDTPRGRGPCGRAIRNGRPAVCRDMLNDPDYAPWRDEAMRRGYRSSICLPLRHEGVVFGTLSFYSADSDAFDADEIRLLEELADSMAFGIMTLRARVRHRRAEEEVRELLAEAERGRNALLSLLEDQKAADSARRESDERFRLAMEHAGVGMALVAPDGRWLEVNPALCRIVGYTREELLQSNFQSITHPDDQARDEQIVRDLIDRRHAPYALEKRYLHKSGRIVWIQLNVALIRDSAGQPLHFVSQMQDISARREAESALAATAERLQIALRVSGHGVWRHNLQTGATEWDRRMFEIFGLPEGPESPTAELILATVVSEDQARVRKSWRVLPDCNHTYNIRFRVLRQDGKVRQVELHGFVHDDGLGRPEWSIGVAADITDLVETAAESGRLRAQLLQSQKMETLGHMAAGVAHDFNNLLTGINGFVELAATTLPPGHEANDLLAQARRGAISARDLVRRILNFSRASRDQARVMVNLVEVVRDTTPLIAATLPANVSIGLAAGCESAPVLADAGQLQQVLMNLCTNSAHAIGRRPGRIEIDLRICDLGSARHPQVPPGCYAGRHVELAVKDNGRGMDDATKRRVFEPFFTTKQAGEGTGLGLAIVHEIVTTHGGGLELESTPGTGTTFRIFLPVTRRESEPARKTTPLLLARGQGQRILVVDDEVSVGSVVQLALRRAGYTTEVFSRPAEAWNRFAAAPDDFELLVVDQNMPEQSGPELCAQMRTLRSGLPIIMMSGRFESGMGAPAILQAEHVTALKKPFEITDLVATVKAALDRTRRT